MDANADPNIVLTGFMGSGKSTVGRCLAERTGRTFVDTDLLIEDGHGPIPDIFALRGESEFRSLEADLARELSKRTGLVVATGGRLMLDPVNAEVLGRAAHVFCLVASTDEVVRRVVGPDGTSDRPLLAQAESISERIAELQQERAAAYAEFDQIATDGRSPDDIADEILRRVGPTRRAEPGDERS